MHTWSQRRLPITVICVTDGEAACPEISDLALIRRQELTCALRELGATRARVVRLQIADGNVAKYESALTDAICRPLLPHSILAAPFELDGHPDHDAAGRAALVAARRRDAECVRFPIWSWHQETPNLRSQPDARRFALNVHALEAKQRAMSQFRSQLTDRPGGAIVPAHVLEYFSRPYEVFLL